MLAPYYANDAKTFLKHFSDCLFYFCSTCVDCLNDDIADVYVMTEGEAGAGDGRGMHQHDC